MAAVSLRGAVGTAAEVAEIRAVAEAAATDASLVAAAAAAAGRPPANV